MVSVGMISQISEFDGAGWAELWLKIRDERAFSAENLRRWTGIRSVGR